jgi:DNA primase
MLYEVVSILDNVLGHSKPFSKGEYYYYCPFCHHYNPKLAVNVNKRKWHCWKCGARGNTLLSLLRKLDVSQEQIRELSALLGDEVQKFKNDDDSQAVLTLPSEYIPLYEPTKSLEAKHAKSYLYRRGFTDLDILKYQVGYCEEGKYQNRVIVPSFDEMGKLNYFIGRDYYDTSGLNYLTPGVSKNFIGFEYYINWEMPIVLVEGGFDAMAVKRNSIPLFGKTLSKKLRTKIIQHTETEVYLALDNDALKETLKIAEYLMQQGVKVFIVELSGKDPANIGFVAMQHLLKTARPLNFVNLVEYKTRLT